MDAWILFTGYALVALWAVGAAVTAHRAAERATHAANALMHSRGRLIALESALETVEARLRKLSGRVYATEPKRKEQLAEELERATLDALPLEEKNAAIRARLRELHNVGHAPKPNGNAAE